MKLSLLPSQVWQTHLQKIFVLEEISEGQFTLVFVEVNDRTSFIHFIFRMFVLDGDKKPIYCISLETSKSLEPDYCIGKNIGSSHETLELVPLLKFPEFREKAIKAFREDFGFSPKTSSRPIMSTDTVSAILSEAMREPVEVEPSMLIQSKDFLDFKKFHDHIPLRDHIQHIMDIMPPNMMANSMKRIASKMSERQGKAGELLVDRYNSLLYSGNYHPEIWDSDTGKAIEEFWIEGTKTLVSLNERPTNELLAQLFLFVVCSWAINARQNPAIGKQIGVADKEEFLKKDISSGGSCLIAFFALSSIFCLPFLLVSWKSFA